MTKREVMHQFLEWYASKAVSIGDFIEMTDVVNNYLAEMK
jgi:hypothetical protein